MKPANFRQVTDFDLKLLRIFKIVAECGSFSAAESLLGITRSAISLHMGDLEKRLGMRLCQRGRAGFSLTDEGREILQASETMMASIEEFRQYVNQIHKQLRGEFNIGIINNLVTQPMMRITNALERLRSASDNILINISMSTPTEIERGILDGRLQVGALPFITPLSGLNYLPLYNERSYLYCSNTHEAFLLADNFDTEQLNQLDAVIPGYRISTEAMNHYKLLNNAATASDREGIAFLILTGKFVGFLPDHYARIWVEKGFMKALLPEQIYYDSKISIVTRKGKRTNAILGLFLEELGY
ncbi:transcriptional regulator [Xenorhabdus stockiae]|uniref:Transcriptional regulator n=1 Tax=Xenorhabdus stockiae TaxID=351614 RepID=A0A2D0KW22_9GAMM|nr:LysR family transcriptional regulator [Xenorhabdus sp. KJ12.1]PHM67323.1 transcriptional regulator [Xenorhabdus sp. KJ12.1]PHM67601.1 transcriptional regulator [Xenorhabdus stockiae]